MYDNGRKAEGIGENDTFRFFPISDKEFSFITWEHYEKKFKETDKDTFNKYKDALEDFFTTIALVYSITWADETDKRLGDAVRIAAHESDQTIPIILGSLKDNFESATRLKNIDEHTLKLKIDDIKNKLELLQLGQTIHSFAFKDIDFGKYPKMDIDVNNMINSFGNNFYWRQLNRKKIYFELEDKRKQKTIIHGSPILVEHAINNLVDNAIKYCYRGTRITCKLGDADGNIIIHIMSCGPAIPQDIDIYKLYSRGDYAKENITEGNGIGLFLCKKLIEAHGWKLGHKSELLYEYDIACMASYCRNNNNYPDVNAEFHELSKSFRSSDFEKHVSLDSAGYLFYIPVLKTFECEYSRKTYLTDFLITIPDKH